MLVFGMSRVCGFSALAKPVRRLHDDGNTAFQPRMLPGMSLEISGKSAQRIGGDVPTKITVIRTSESEH